MVLSAPSVRPRPFQGLVPTNTEDARRGQFPDPPGWWEDSLAEWAIYWAHGPLQRGEPYPEGPLWAFRLSPFGTSVAGFVPDFLEFSERISINVNEVGGDPRGEAATRANEATRKVVMLSLSYTHVVIDSNQALASPIDCLRRALAGQDSKAGV